MVWKVAKKGNGLLDSKKKEQQQEDSRVYYAIMKLYERMQCLIAMLGTFTFTLKNNKVLLKKRYTTMK